MDRYEIMRLLVYVAELERLLDMTVNPDLNRMIADSDTYAGQLWQALPYVREWAQDQLEEPKP